MTNRYLKEHSFSPKIMKILQKEFGDNAKYIFANSPLIGYLNIKTKSADKTSKTRGSFGNIYALYVIIEDYVCKGYAVESKQKYSDYEGAKFTALLEKVRELPFGTKIQNHALNSRLNGEFKKYYPALDESPIIRDLETQRYWIHEDLLKIAVPSKNGSDINYNLASSILQIIKSYINVKCTAFQEFLQTCKTMASLTNRDTESAIDFIKEQLKPNKDARIFEIVSYAILKEKYNKETVWIGKTKESVKEKFLELYKTGRTNANDGGIDFVMRPIGRFFQVTETTNTNKYFLDIDKIYYFPVTFVIKTENSSNDILKLIRKNAESKFKIKSVIEKYMNSVEDVINIPNLVQYLEDAAQSNSSLQQIMIEIVSQSKMEFNQPASDVDI